MTQHQPTLYEDDDSGCCEACGKDVDDLRYHTEQPIVYVSAPAEPDDEPEMGPAGGPRYFEPALDSKRAASEAMRKVSEMLRLRPLAEYHEDYGSVLLWRVPIMEPPVVASAGDMPETPGEYIVNWAYYTHWSLLPAAYSPNKLSLPGKK